jgi:hypothetical protein
MKKDIILVLSLPFFIFGCGQNSDNSPGAAQVQSGPASPTFKDEADQDFLRIHKDVFSPVDQRGYKAALGSVDTLIKDLEKYSREENINHIRHMDGYVNTELQNFRQREGEYNWVLTGFPDSNFVVGRIDYILKEAKFQCEKLESTPAHADCIVQLNRYDELQAIIVAY